LSKRVLLAISEQKVKHKLETIRRQNVLSNSNVRIYQQHPIDQRFKAVVASSEVEEKEA